MNFNEKHNERTLSMESLSEIYHKKLDDILYMELTVENINTFAQTAEKQLLKLNDQILEQYASNPLFEGDKSLSIKAQEDDAYQKLGLPNLQDILKLIIDKINQINVLKLYIQEQTEPIDQVITPPQPDIPTPTPGSGTYVEKQKLPRLLSLIYILNNDLNIPLENISITEGRLRPEMMRKTPYSRVIAQSLNRLIYICNEEGNASYIFDQEKLDNLNIEIEEIDIDDKDRKNNLILQYPGIGVRIIQRGAWRESITRALTQPLPMVYDQIRSEPKVRRTRSEFVPFPAYSEFQVEVQKLYQVQGSPSNIKEWYKIEYQNHPNWPSNPNATYANKGWQSSEELVGREKRSFLPFAEFQAEVQKLYQKQGNPSSIFKWYQVENKKHPDWPSTPHDNYASNGWQSWEELVGREKRSFLPFAEFQAEVQKLYQKQGNPSSIFKWYQVEYKKHPNWPSAPHDNYASNGWQSWEELIGKEKKTFLPFAEFQAEVQKQYQEQDSPSSILRWYITEYKKHSKWPSAPYLNYAKNGWQSWEELVGKGKKTFLPFTEFQAEVQKLYRKQGSPSGSTEWYRTEYKNHPNWPSEPHATYANKGWKNWNVFVNKEKINPLPYSEFQAEVQRLYKEQGSPLNIFKWYKAEYKNHSLWPSVPDRIYESNGWKSWEEFVGKGKKTFLTYSELREEVQKRYKEQGSPPGSIEWYKTERKNRPNWPSVPNAIYAKNGWVNWNELIGKEKKNFLPYSEFQAEVQKSYQEQGGPSNINKWYKKEYNKHSSWPSVPNHIYSDNGWKNWEELVGKEKKNFLPYTELQAEVQKFYQEQGSPANIYKWYKTEYINHSSWPSAPDRSFASNGWKSWLNLVGK